MEIKGIIIKTKLFGIQKFPLSFNAAVSLFATDWLKWVHDRFNPNSFTPVRYQHALRLFLCVQPGFHSDPREVKMIRVK